ncbi:putative ISWI chromatin-remodeling complex ATPase CHR17 [Blattamonas nauphoetae]|uniref:ISWI chromatin-remodeling complex ATPase CHR17 n=1 Tax=Blattamonas nauphoetae TaxID=2049346 RepID=A0ABQ9Y9X8_9EUKA|nr:putative ISWI chromatin-remodeling complex ATPase CHR17 [Blattamonas nauphoetae]
MDFQTNSQSALTPNVGGSPTGTLPPVLSFKIQVKAATETTAPWEYIQTIPIYESLPQTAIQPSFNDFPVDFDTFDSTDIYGRRKMHLRDRKPVRYDSNIIYEDETPRRSTRTTNTRPRSAPRPPKKDSPPPYEVRRQTRGLTRILAGVEDPNEKKPKTEDEYSDESSMIDDQDSQDDDDYTNSIARRRYSKSRNSGRGTRSHRIPLIDTTRLVRQAQERMNEHGDENQNSNDDYEEDGPSPTNNNSAVPKGIITTRSGRAVSASANYGMYNPAHLSSAKKRELELRKQALKEIQSFYLKRMFFFVDHWNVFMPFLAEEDRRNHNRVIRAMAEQGQMDGRVAVKLVNEHIRERQRKEQEEKDKETIQTEPQDPNISTHPEDDKSDIKPTDSVISEGNQEKSTPSDAIIHQSTTDITTTSHSTPTSHNQTTSAPLPAEEEKPDTTTPKEEISTTDEPISILTHSQVPYIHADLRYYQVDGVRWMLKQHDYGAGGILGDEMGLGKTIQICSFLAALKNERGEKGPHLILAPLSVYPTWKDELARWTPSLKVLAIHGPPTERRRATQEFAEDVTIDVVVTTYDIFLTTKEWFLNQFWSYVILDECQRIKSEQTLVGQAIRQVRSLRRLLLIGTPLQNNMHELWAFLNFLYPELLSCSSSFDNGLVSVTPSPALSRFSYRSFNQSGGTIDVGVMNAAHRLLKAVMLRRLKRNVLKLPPKAEVKVFVPLSRVQVSFYRSLLQDYAGVLSSDQLEMPPKSRRGRKSALQKQWELEMQASTVQEEMNGDEDDSLSPSQTPKPTPTTTPLPPFSRPFENTQLKASLSNLLITLRKCCNHPFLFTNEFKRKPRGDPEGGGWNYELLRKMEENGRLSKADRKTVREKFSRLGSELEELIVGSGKLRVLDGILKKLKKENDELDAERIQAEQSLKEARWNRKKVMRDFIRTKGHAQTEKENEGTGAHEDTDKHDRKTAITSTDLETQPALAEAIRIENEANEKLQQIIDTEKANAEANKQKHHKVLIYSQYTQTLDVLEHYCKLSHWEYLRLDGSTPLSRRVYEMHKFLDDSNPQWIYLITTRAGGLGLNLQSADVVVLYDTDFNPTIDRQAQDRAHRIGQTRPVRVFRLICKNTCEERVLQMAERKSVMGALVLKEDGTEENEEEGEDVMYTKSMTFSDLKDIVRFGAESIETTDSLGFDNDITEETIQTIIDTTWNTTNRMIHDQLVEQEQKVLKEEEPKPSEVIQVKDLNDITNDPADGTELNDVDTVSPSPSPTADTPALPDSFYTLQPIEKKPQSLFDKETVDIYSFEGRQYNRNVSAGQQTIGWMKELGLSGTAEEILASAIDRPRRRDRKNMTVEKYVEGIGRVAIPMYLIEEEERQRELEESKQRERDILKTKQSTLAHIMYCDVCRRRTDQPEPEYSSDGEFEIAFQGDEGVEEYADTDQSSDSDTEEKRNDNDDGTYLDTHEDERWKRKQKKIMKEAKRKPAVQQTPTPTPPIETKQDPQAENLAPTGRQQNIPPSSPNDESPSVSSNSMSEMMKDEPFESLDLANGKSMRVEEANHQEEDQGEMDHAEADHEDDNFGEEIEEEREEEEEAEEEDNPENSIPSKQIIVLPKIYKRKKHILCTQCPSTAHVRCLLHATDNVPVRSLCLHHRCADCSRSASEAGGLLFRCVYCCYSWCPRCIKQDFKTVQNGGSNSANDFTSFNKMGYVLPRTYELICCHDCVNKTEEERGPRQGEEIRWFNKHTTDQGEAEVYDGADLEYEDDEPSDTDTAPEPETATNLEPGTMDKKEFMQRYGRQMKKIKRLDENDKTDSEATLDEIDMNMGELDSELEEDTSPDGGDGSEGRDYSDDDYSNLYGSKSKKRKSSHSSQKTSLAPGVLPRDIQIALAAVNEEINSFQTLHDDMSKQLEELLTKDTYHILPVLPTTFKLDADIRPLNTVKRTPVPADPDAIKWDDTTFYAWPSEAERVEEEREPYATIKRKLEHPPKKRSAGRPKNAAKAVAKAQTGTPAKKTGARKSRKSKKKETEDEHSESTLSELESAQEEKDPFSDEADDPADTPATSGRTAPKQASGKAKAAKGTPQEKKKGSKSHKIKRSLADTLPKKKEKSVNTQAVMKFTQQKSLPKPKFRPPPRK